MVKLFVATPAYGCMVTTSYLMSIVMLRMECAKRNIECLVDFIGNESLITRARNLLVEQFLKTDSTHLVFIDADISFLPESIFSMIEADKDVMCSIYPKKSYLWNRATLPSNEPMPQRCLDFNINIAQNTEILNGRYCKVLDAATGFMMIKREAIEKIKKAFVSLTCKNDVLGYNIDEYVAMFDCMIDPETRRYLSEDYAFCRRWQMLGGEIWTDVKNILGHEGSFYYSPTAIPSVQTDQKQSETTTK